MKILLCLAFSLLLIPIVSFAKNNRKIQNTKAAAKYFSHELSFTSGPMTLKSVSEGKLEGIIVDLRKKEHFQKGHVPNAINLPFDEYQSFSGNDTHFPGLSKDKINYLYCYELTCNLSQKAGQKFASLGYPVKEVRGGFKDWKDRSFPITSE